MTINLTEDQQHYINSLINRDHKKVLQEAFLLHSLFINSEKTNTEIMNNKEETN